MKEQIKNLRHSYRWMKRRCTLKETLAWIEFYNKQDRYIIEKIYLNS